MITLEKVQAKFPEVIQIRFAIGKEQIGSVFVDKGFFPVMRSPEILSNRDFSTTPLLKNTEVVGVACEPVITSETVQEAGEELVVVKFKIYTDFYLFKAIKENIIDIRYVISDYVSGAKFLGFYIFENIQKTRHMPPRDKAAFRLIMMGVK